MTATVTFKAQTWHTEGSYSALVTVYGQEFAIQYVAGEVRVYGTAGQKGRKPWQVESAAKAARKAAEERIAGLGSDFAAAHTALYAEEG